MHKAESRAVKCLGFVTFYEEVRLVLLLRLGRNFLLFHQSKPNSYSYSFHLLIFFHNSLKSFLSVANINTYSEKSPQIPQIIFYLVLVWFWFVFEMFLLHKLLVSLLNTHVLNIFTLNIHIYSGMQFSPYFLPFPSAAGINFSCCLCIMSVLYSGAAAKTVRLSPPS